MIYFISNTLFYTDKTNSHYDEYMISQWNKDVAADDEVYVLGGLFRINYTDSFNKNYIENVVKKLNGKIHVVPQTLDDMEIYFHLDTLGLVEWQFQYDIIYQDTLVVATADPIDIIEYDNINTLDYWHLANVFGNSLAYQEELVPGGTYCCAAYETKRRMISIDELWIDINQKDYMANVEDALFGIEDDEDFWD
jgi:hypothetical protein